MSAKAARYRERQSKNSHVGQNALMQSQPVKDVIQYATDYVRENPESAALWCFGIGFILGWKLKPW